MIVNVYSSYDKSLIFCLEDIKKNVYNDLDGDIDFIMFAISPEFPIMHVNLLIKKVFKDIQYIAFHAVEAFSNCSIIQRGVVASIFKFKNVKVNYFYKETINDKNSVLDTANYLNANKNKFHIMISSYMNGALGEFIESLSNELNYAPIDNIVGGISSGIEKNNEFFTYIFLEDKIIKDGFAIVSFDNVIWNIEISLGFKPYGITYTITKSEGSKIYEIDNGRKFSEVIDSILDNIEYKDMRYLWYTPLNILDDEDGYVSTLRTIEYYNNQYVKLFGPVKKGQHFKMSFATYKNLLEEDKKAAYRVLSNISIPEIIFNFSCIAREYVLEDRREEEIKLYTDILNSHLFGFFTFGEIGPDRMFKSLKLYNETSLLVAMKEKI